VKVINLLDLLNAVCRGDIPEIVVTPNIAEIKKLARSGVQLPGVEISTKKTPRIRRNKDG
jgi:hypothetical protein